MNDVENKQLQTTSNGNAQTAFGTRKRTKGKLDGKLTDLFA